MNLTFGKRKKTVVCLGLFDGMHLGHKKVIEEARKVADQQNEKLVCITFSGNLKGKINANDEKVLYTDKERFEALEELGVDQIFALKPDDETLGMNSNDFLDLINKKYNISTYVCGEDYRFGYNGCGNLSFLRQYANVKGQKTVVVDQVKIKDKKISTRDIKQLVLNGDVESANALLNKNFYYSGKVVKGDKLGRLLGFPTANIYIDKDKLKIQAGVYYGKMEIDGAYYKVMLNFGFQPTFDSEKYKIEAHVIGFNGNLYGTKVKIHIIKKIRDTVKFNSVNDLIIQLQKDRRAICEGKYD